MPRYYRNILAQPDLDALQTLIGATVSVLIDRHGIFINRIIFEPESGPRIAMQAAGEDHETRFETFRLMVKKQEETRRTENLRRLFGIVAVDVLLREESRRPASDAEMEGLLGSGPADVQTSHPPGETPSGATASALVAAGVLLTDTTAHKLAICADTYPYAMKAFTDDETSHLSSGYEILSLADYMSLYLPDRKAP